jgi:hypothetical protein
LVKTKGKSIFDKLIFEYLFLGEILGWGGIGLGLPQVKTSVVPSVTTPSLIITFGWGSREISYSRDISMNLYIVII